MQQRSTFQQSQPSRLTADRCCEQDVEDLSELLRYLQRRRGAKRIAIVGHSTGCQVIVHFMATADEELRRIVQLCVLQAPVSDREAAEGSGVGPEVVSTARRHVDAGEGETLVHRSDLIRFEFHLNLILIRFKFD